MPDQLMIGGYAFDSALFTSIAIRVGMVAAILLVTWILAKIAKWTFAKLVDRIGLFRRSMASGDSVGMTLGRVVSLFVWLFGLIAVLNYLHFDSATRPIEAMLTDVMGFLPNLIGAGIIFFVGLMIARIVKELVETGMSAVNLDRWAQKGGVEQVTGNAAISKTIGTIVFVLIIIPVAVAALQALKVSSISDPLVAMLTTILAAVPNIIGAAAILGLAFVIARFTSSLIEELLAGLGIDRAVAALEVLPESAKASSVAARVSSVAIMLVAAIAATRLLGFPELTALVDELLQLGSKVIFGGVIIVVGVLLANMLAGLVRSASGEGIGVQVVRGATIILFAAMGLKYMGLADSIIEMAFGALVIGGAAAGALAFGLGGRDAAARLIEDMRAKGESAPAKPARKTAAKPKDAA